MKKLILLDSHALLHRSYHALPPLVSEKGILVNGVYGFLLVFLKIIRELKPDYLAATFDLKGPTFRHLEYKEYKAKRVKVPENFYEQVEIVKRFLNAFGVLILEKEGYEADDIIATIVEKFKDEDLEIIILTGDLDTLQLVNDKVSVYTFGKGIKDQIIYTPSKIKQRYNLEPKELIDFKALKGDPSDNIKGVPKIGEKTAKTLIEKYKNLDNLYKLIEENKIKDLSLSILANLKEYKKEAFFSRQLVALDNRVPIEFNLNEMKWQEPKKEKIVPLLEEFGFKSLISKIFPEENKEILVPQTSFIVCDTNQRINQLKEKISEEKEIGLIMDFRGEKVYEREVFGLVFVFRGKNIFYLKKDSFSDFLQTIDLKNKTLITYEAKILYQEIPYFLNYLLDDLKIKIWLTDPDRKNYNFKEVASYLLKKEIKDDLQNKAAVIFDLEDILSSKMTALDLDFAYETIEKPLIKVIAKMERRGILVDEKKLLKLNSNLSEKIVNLEKEIFAQTGEIFNINSPVQLTKILFEKLKIDSKNLKKTATGKISTDSSELKKIENLHPVVPLIEEYRELKKLKNSFLDLLPNFINKQTKRIYTIFNQTGTATGRLSSGKPNLLNIPLRSDWGRKIRNCFITEKDWIFLSLDYSQIDLRVAAHLSNDSTLKEAFLKDIDIHLLTASKIYNVAIDQVTPLMRQQAKILNFGIIYGMGENAFAEAAGISKNQAKIFREEYFSDFVGLKLYLDKIVNESKKNGFGETIFKRKRFLPLIGALGRIGREEERIAVNFPIQGSVSDLINLAMIKIDEFLREKELENKVFLVCQIHDELLFEGKFEIIEAMEDKLKEIMENVYPLSVPLKVKVKTGKTWLEASE
ncbi:MAG TPA: DNA polymerase I [Candidatus Paceibacterota bacterium]|nr:DNA polymerase I [Candidatus Paceibacterota bacterium]